MKLEEVLSGRAGLAGVRWLLLGREARQAFGRQVASLVGSAQRIAGCDLLQARFNPGRKLSAWYHLDLRLRPGRACSARAIAVTWSLESGPSPDQAAHLIRLEAEAAQHRLLAPFRRLFAHVPDWGLRLHISPLDPGFPQLVRLSDPRHVRGLVAQAHARTWSAPDQEPARGYRVRVVRYRPGQRHVLRYDPVAGGGAAVFAKLYAREEGELAFRVARQVGHWLAEHGAVFTPVRPLAYIPEDGVMLYPEVAGQPLSLAWKSSGPAPAEHLREAGRALAALHRSAPEFESALDLHDFAAELEVLRRAGRHVPLLLGSAGGMIEDVLERARALHERLASPPVTFTHGDFKAEHLWVTPQGLQLIDFDTCRFSDPALDVGKFLADLRWWFTVDERAGLETAQQDFLAGYGRSEAPGFAARARIYESLNLVKFALRRIPLIERHWARRTRRMIGRARALLDQIDRPAPSRSRPKRPPQD